MDYTVLTSRSSIMEMARLIELIFAQRLSSTYRVQFVLYSILRKFGYFQKMVLDTSLETLSHVLDLEKIRQLP